MAERYLLDTNICIFLQKGRKEVVEKFRRIGLHSCFISEMTCAEMLFGAYNSGNKDEINFTESFLAQFKVIPVYEALTIYARQKARLKKAGTPVSDFDLLIGSTAIAHGYVMVTDNLKDFMPQEGIRLENWVRR